jgi:ArsR family transcriptional regulator
MHPYLVLQGVAARHLLFRLRLQPYLLKPIGCHCHFGGRFHLNTQMIQASSRTRILNQDKLERRVSDCKVSVTRTTLSRFRPQQFLVEIDGSIDIPDIERNLNSLVTYSASISMFINIDVYQYLAKYIDVCQYRKMKVTLPLTSCCSPSLPGTLKPEDAEQMAALFRVLGEPARLQLLSFIATHPAGEACVCELTEPLGLSQPTVSHHLKVMFEAGLLQKERRGNWMYYKAVPEQVEFLQKALSVLTRSLR